MSLGGGTFISQNKKLPGSYINFVGTPKATGISERGTAAVGLPLAWGELGKFVSVTNEALFKSCKKMFGCEYTDIAMLPLREMLCHANKLLVYRLGENGTQAVNDLGKAKYVGIAGNKITTTVTATTDGEEQSGWLVQTYFGNEVVDEQKADVGDKASVLKDNDFVVWNDEVELTTTSKTTGVMTGGADPDEATSHGDFLSALQTKNFNTVACSSTKSAIISEYVAFAKTMRDTYGIKCQAVVYGNEADYEGVINAVNDIEGETVPSGNIVYWVAGAEAGCAVNKSCTNMAYDGELAVNANHTQEVLEEALEKGHLIMHLVGDEIKILEDVNSLVNFTQEKTEDFKYNQTIRVLDQLANDISRIYNARYIGVVQNDAAGRESLWGDIVTLCNDLQNMRAIEKFDAKNVEVLPGDTKKAVVVNMWVTPVNAMAQLYCTVYVM